MSNYRIILRGVVKGRSADQVAIALARMSKKTSRALIPLLDGRDVVVKRTFEIQKAVQYKQALEKIGCVCVVEAEITPVTAASSAPAITVDLTTPPDRPRQKQNAAPKAEYAKKPGAAVRALAGTVRVLDWMMRAVVLLIALYYVRKLFY